MSRYSDPTACKAIKKVDKEDAKARKLLLTILNICDLAGFRIEGKIHLVNKKDERAWIRNDPDKDA